MLIPPSNRRARIMGRRGPRPEVRYWNRQGGGYFATIAGRKVCLALGPDDAPKGPTYLTALDVFLREMRQEQGRGTDRFAVGALIRAYWTHLDSEGRDASAANVRAHLGPFVARQGIDALPVADLR